MEGATDEEHHCAYTTGIDSRAEASRANPSTPRTSLPYPIDEEVVDFVIDTNASITVAVTIGMYGQSNATVFSIKKKNRTSTLPCLGTLCLLVGHLPALIGRSSTVT